MAGRSSGKKDIRGTREWAVAEINCCLGCNHGCKYCYARYDAVKRKGQATREEWDSCRVIQQEVNRSHPRYPGQVMFPTAHDIVPENLESCIRVLHNLFKAGNRVLVVSKPHLVCVQRICDEFAHCKSQLLFRFTITARSDDLLQFWEPQAPGYAERKRCLRYCYDRGFGTSVSVEPMLDTSDVVAMVHELLPSISHSIWLGKMNSIDKRVTIDSREMQNELERIRLGQSDEKISELYHQLAAVDRVRWKESIKEIVGIEPVSEPGLDI